MQSSEALEKLIPHPAPTGRPARALLIALRRIATGGLDDATATNMLIATFGMGYRRPLMFLRVLMQEISRVAEGQITVAPCCCTRMTEGEATILLAVESGMSHPHVARAALSRVTGSLDVLPALSIAQALGEALEDLGRPITL